MFGLPLQWVVIAGAIKVVIVVLAVTWYYRNRAKKLQKELRDEKAATATYKRVVKVDRHRDADDDAISRKLRDYSKRGGNKGNRSS